MNSIRTNRFLMSIFLTWSFVMGPIFCLAESRQDDIQLNYKVREVQQQYPTVEMKSVYQSKDVAKGVVYLSETERENYRIIISNGVVYTHDGAIVEDSTNNKIGHLNQINYVMDANGNFYLFNEYAHEEIRHSSILAGGAVAGAGEITIKNGHIIFINSDSGHYKTESLMSNVLSELKNDGVDLGTLSSINEY